MNKTNFREITLLVILPLLLASMFLAAAGTSHPFKATQVNRSIKTRQESAVLNVQCYSLCQYIQNLEKTLIESDKAHESVIH